MELIKKLYYWFTGYSYTNLGRLFLRLFVGIMFLQFGVRQLYQFDSLKEIFPSALGMSPELSLILMIIIEIGCSLFIMSGFLTRLMSLPPIAAMIVAESHLLRFFSETKAVYDLGWENPVYLPIMFLGFYFFILIVGPGKISVDYFLSLHMIHTDNKSEEELEEV